MDPFGNFGMFIQQPERESPDHNENLINFPDQWPGLGEEDQESAIEKILAKAVGVVKKFWVLSGFSIGVLAFLILLIPFLRFVFELSSWAYNWAGRIFP